MGSCRVYIIKTSMEAEVSTIFQKFSSQGGAAGLTGHGHASEWHAPADGRPRPQPVRGPQARAAGNLAFFRNFTLANRALLDIFSETATACLVTNRSGVLV